MSTIHTILVPFDLTEPSDSIAQQAIEWARTHRARIVFLHVVPNAINYAFPAFVDSCSYETYYSRARELARHRLEPLARSAVASGIEAAVHIRVGFPAEEIIEEAGEIGAGLIVLGTHGRRGLAHFILGSTAGKVVRLASCPVLVVKEPRPVVAETPAVNAVSTADVAPTA